MIRPLLSDTNTPPELKKFIMTKTGLGKEGQGVSYGDFVPKPIPRDPLADHAANRRFDLAHPTPTPESNTQPQIFYDAQNKPHAIQFMHGQTNEIPLPPNLTGKTGLSSVTANRADSAQAVVQTGNDIIAELNDPNFRNVLGPAMGRTSTLRDFIGNPPPEFSRLAGQIESFSLANMGVHGMRSSIGADKIKKLLDAHHTPESLVQAILGLTDFSNHFIENTGRSVQDNNSTTADGGGWTDLGNGVRIRKKK